LDQGEDGQLYFHHQPSKPNQPAITCNEKNKSDEDALIIFTSGTTGKPKGVVLTHKNIEAMVTNLIHAWEWTKNDQILLVLPLHHVHGVINVLACAVWSGACCYMSQFNALKTWDFFIQSQTLTLFMAVPTIYVKLIEAYSTFDPEKKLAATASLQRLRLMVSGSAALPEPVFNSWFNLSGHRLLERYGMTEIGMALSNPLHPISSRISGSVGMPMPNVLIKINSEGDSQEGELLIKSPQVFNRYYNRPEETAKAFDDEGWFKTGDEVKYDPNTESYRILGRQSSDIIKSGGYKISALEIERCLLSFEGISEAAVVGIPDEQWGQIITAIIVWSHPSQFDETGFQNYLNKELAKYKHPKKIIHVDEIPRNAMGKVNKKELVKWVLNRSS